MRNTDLVPSGKAEPRPKELGPALPHVVLAAEFEAGSIGGGESVVRGLAAALDRMRPVRQRYTLLTSPSMAEALAGSLAPPNRIAVRPKPTQGPVKRARGLLSHAFPRAASAARRLAGRVPQGLPLSVGTMDEFIAGLAPDLIHFLYPLHYQICPIPVIYTFHDLQVEHLPHLFSPDHIAWRRKIHCAAVQRSQSLVAISRFVANDLVSRLPTSSHKLYVIPWAPYISHRLGHDAAAQPPRANLDLPSRFLLYPAVTYAHKNHLGLVRALGILEKSAGFDLDLVLTGARTPYWSEVKREIKKCVRRRRVLHLGYISPRELDIVYTAAEAVVFPSLFEGAGLPLLEALAYGKKVCCSELAVFREFGGSVPEYFDPHAPGSIAEAIKRCLRAPGKQARTDAWDWYDVARLHRALYRKTLGAQLCADEEEAICAARLRPETASEGDAEETRAGDRTRSRGAYSRPS